VKGLRQVPVRIFAVLVGSFIYFLLEAKYVSTIFLSLHLPGKIYIQSKVGELLYYFLVLSVFLFNAFLSFP